MNGDPTLVEVQVADDPESWRQAGFTVDGDRLYLGTVAVRLTGAAEQSGIVGWTLAGIEVTTDIDGLPTAIEAPGTAEANTRSGHPNGVHGLDHIVVMTPDLGRTMAALADAGFTLRRIRDVDTGGTPLRQAFYRFSNTILEVVSSDSETGRTAQEAPATWFGLAADVKNLSATATEVGDALGPIKPAVQKGRRIATIRHRDLGMSVAVAVMDHRADQ